MQLEFVSQKEKVYLLFSLQVSQVFAIPKIRESGARSAECPKIELKLNFQNRMKHARLHVVRWYTYLLDLTNTDIDNTIKVR
jgi:hypothetical protein